MNKKQRKKIKKSLVSGKGKACTIRAALQETLRNLDVVIESYDDCFKVDPEMKKVLMVEYKNFFHMKDEINCVLERKVLKS